MQVHEFSLMIVMRKTMILLLLFSIACQYVAAEDTSFDQNYYISWGKDHTSVLDQGKELQLSMDTYSGAGFESKLYYGSVYLNMSIKLPGRDSAGVVTAFYLTSHGDRHDELDMEFLGNQEGKAYTLQTNVFCSGVGGKEQRIALWFDPTMDFHIYTFLWNGRQIVWYVDGVPVRVLKNSKGSCYPSQSMQVVASLWNGEAWATDGGLTKTNWTYAPFHANFRGFNMLGCPESDHKRCHLRRVYPWNSKQFWNLNPIEQGQYEDVRKKYLTYDYCTDINRYHIQPPECPFTL